MADTGAPWNLPYPLPTDLVRDGADAIKDLAEAVADGLDDAGSAGIGPNVVQVAKTNAFSHNSNTLTNVDGFSATITPSAATSKVLVIVTLALGHSNNFATQRINLRRGTTDIFESTAGSVSNATYALDFIRSASNTESVEEFTIVYLDSPGVATATTYTVAVATSEGTIFVNRPSVNANRGSTSSITVIEVSA